jgi:hypothetical protein
LAHESLHLPHPSTGHRVGGIGQRRQKEATRLTGEVVGG